jgi:hypothetical protein
MPVADNLAPHVEYRGGYRPGSGRPRASFSDIAAAKKTQMIWPGELYKELHDFATRESTSVTSIVRAATSEFLLRHS